MQVYSTLQIGEFHTNYCEDFLIHEQVATNEKLIAVMDGCTMAKESAFASILVGKVLRNIAKHYYYQEFVDTNHLDLKTKLKSILQQLFSELKKLKNQLGLATEELLTTLLIALVNEETSQAEFLCLGDGLIYYDGNSLEFEQDNKPDYLGYHLSEDFEEFYSQQEQRLSLNQFEDLSICTDGIFTFQSLQKMQSPKSESEIIEFLLEDNQFEQKDNFLDRKIRILREEYFIAPTDDLAIIRIKK